MSRIAVWIGALALCSCAIGRPPGYSEGVAWVAPLMGALEGGFPVTPVEINGKGPFLFAINPDSESTIHPLLAKELKLWAWTSDAEKLVDESDSVSHEQLRTVDVDTLRVGNLTVSRRKLLAIPSGGAYNGQPIVGIIGHDILADSLVWAIDRDRQKLYIATQGHLGPSPGAKKIPIRVSRREFFVDVTLEQQREAHLRVYFNGPTSLWPEVAGEAGLAAAGTSAWRAGSLAVGEARARNLIFGPFRDQRVERSEADGELGQSFWSRFSILVNLHEKSIWVTDRAQDIAALSGERLSRWGSLWQGCQRPACVDLRIERSSPASSAQPAATATQPSADPDEAQPGSSGPQPAADPDEAKVVGGGGAQLAPASGGPGHLIIAREPSKKDLGYDILIEAADENGKPIGLPYVRVAMPQGATEMRFALTAMGTGFARAARFRVIDATPFPPVCSNSDGCLWLVQ